MIQKKKKKNEVITNTISKLQNPGNFNYLSKTHTGGETLAQRAQNLNINSPH